VAETWQVWRDVSESALVETKTPSNAPSFDARLNIWHLSHSSKYTRIIFEFIGTHVDRSHIEGDMRTSEPRSTPETQLAGPIGRFGTSISLKRRSLGVPRVQHVWG